MTLVTRLCPLIAESCRVGTNDLLRFSLAHQLALLRGFNCAVRVFSACKRSRSFVRRKARKATKTLENWSVHNPSLLRPVWLCLLCRLSLTASDSSHCIVWSAVEQ